MQRVHPARRAARAGDVRVLGAANAYLGLRAGMTIAATYPGGRYRHGRACALMKGSILEENIARTVGSIGESVAAGAVFTIPAFVLAGVWPAFDVRQRLLEIRRAHGWWAACWASCSCPCSGASWWKTPNCPSPNRWPRREIHKAGQQGAQAAKILFANMGFGAADLSSWAAIQPLRRRAATSWCTSATIGRAALQAHARAGRAQR